MRIVVRADSSKTMGFGHITRSLTLARALQDAGADVVSVGQGMREGIALSSSFQDLQIIERAPSHDADEVEQILALQPDGVVTDGYHFSRNFFEQLDKASIPYAAIDDNGETEAINPIAIHNQNPHANRELYGDFFDEPLFMLGLNFALLRPEVTKLAAKPHKKSGKIVVSLGGTDSENLTVPITSALIDSGYGVAINERFKDALNRARNDVGHSDKIEFFPPQMFLKTLRSAKLAVLGAGTSLWEANALGTPAVGVIVAENQVQPALRAVSDGYVTEMVNAITAPTKSSLVSEVIELATQLQGEWSQKPPKRVQPDSAAKVADAMLVQLSNHLDNIR